MTIISSSISYDIISTWHFCEPRGSIMPTPLVITRANDPLISRCDQPTDSDFPWSSLVRPFRVNRSGTGVHSRLRQLHTTMGG